MRNNTKFLLLAAVAGAALAGATQATAQATAQATPPAPEGGFYMADGGRTADYQAALESWRADAQFSVDYSKGYMGLEHAYARGLTGRGVMVGVNDAGVYIDHPLFQSAGKITGLHTAVPDGYGNDGKINPRRQWEGHGTHVAGTVAGDRIAGETMFGVAYGANIFSATSNFAAGDFLWFKDQIIDGRTVATSNQNIVDLANGGARIINNSWGSSNSLPYNASRAQVLAAFNRNYGDFYDPILTNDALVVFSAGNGGGAHAGIDAAAPMSDPRLRSNWLSVANYRSDDTPSPSTSFCGQTATWCVAGPGHQIVSSVPGYQMDVQGLLGLYPVSQYASLYSVSTVAQLQQAVVNRFLVVLNDYLDAKYTAEDAGLPFDEDAARQAVAREAVAITVVSGLLLGTPDGMSTQLGSLLTSAGNMAILTPEFSSAVLEYADAEMARVLGQYIDYTGADYEAYTGTSMAAPNISGFAALLMEQFPEYDTALIADILVSSSRDLDTPGVDLRSGWGAPQMEVALNGPTALRDVRDVTVGVGTVDVWTNDIGDARDRYSAEVLAAYPDDIGGLVKKGGGELILTGQNSYTGSTRVEGGLLTVNGALLASDATVADVGMIGGVGRLLNLTAESGGVVAPGTASDPFGVLTVSGDATFKEGSFLWVRSSVNGGAYSRLVVDGLTMLEGGEVIVKADQGNWNLRSRLNILQANGGLSGVFAGAKSDLAFLTPVLTYQSDRVVLTLQRNDVTVASLGATPNERALGGALDVMITGTPAASRDMSLENALLDGSVQNVTAALSSLTGEVHASLGGVASSDTRYIRNAMLTRGRDGATDQTQGSGVSAWGSGVFGNGEFEGDSDLAAYRTESTGYLVGVDKAWGNGAHIGVALGQSRSELQSDRLRSSGTVRGDHIGVYGGLKAGDFAFRLGGSWMDANTRTNRTASLNQFSNQLSADYDGAAWQAYGEIAWVKPVGNTVFEPYASYTRIDYDADVVETGGDAALSGEVNQTSDLLTAGLRTRTTLSEGAGRPTLQAVTHLAWTHDLNGDGPLFNAAFSDGPVFVVQGANIGADALSAGLGVNIQATQAANIEFGYSGLYQEDFSDHRITGRISLKF